MTDENPRTQTDSTSNRGPSRWWVLFPAGLTVLCVVLIVAINHYRSRLYRLEDSYQGLEFRMLQLEEDASRLRQMLGQGERPRLQLEPTLTRIEAAVLIKKGVQDPYHELAVDLTTNPQIDGVPPGEVLFTDSEQVCILGPDRAIAEYESDDSSGRAILSYQVNDEGRISWQVLELHPY